MSARPLIGWDISNFFFATAEQNSTKLDRKQDLNVPYHTCVFQADRNSRSPSWPLFDWESFGFFSAITERNSMKLGIKQDLDVLYQDCVFPGRSDSQDGHWLAMPYSTSSLQPLKGIQRNLIWNKISISPTTCFGPIRKQRWPSWSLIDWDYFDFISATGERNSIKLDRKQDLNVLNQVWVYRTDRKTKMATRSLIGWDIFLCNRCNFFLATDERIQQNLIGSKISKRPHLCFSGRSEFKITALSPDSPREFRFLLCNRWKEFNETWQETNLNVPYNIWFFFLADQETKMAALVSDWLRHFWLLLCNHWK